jgi:hypothetical protein
MSSTRRIDVTELQYAHEDSSFYIQEPPCYTHATSTDMYNIPSSLEDADYFEKIRTAPRMQLCRAAPAPTLLFNPQVVKIKQREQ